MTTFGPIRRDPQEGENGFSKNEGFTLIELMVVIAVVAIITSFALPSYRMLIEKRQVTSGAEQLASFISSAQIEAVKRSNNVSVSYTRTDSDTWCVGMVTGLTACDCQETDPTSTSPLACAIDTQLRVYTDATVTYPQLSINPNKRTVVSPHFDPKSKESKTNHLSLYHSAGRL